MSENSMYSIENDDNHRNLRVIRRNGAVVPFNSEKIKIAIQKAFIAVHGGNIADSSKIRDIVLNLTKSVVEFFSRRFPDNSVIHIEDIQDRVELALMRFGEHDVARAYVLYRERRAAERSALLTKEGKKILTITDEFDGGKRKDIDQTDIVKICRSACADLEGAVDSETMCKSIIDQAIKNMYEGASLTELHLTLVLAARTLIDTDPEYGKAAARLLLINLGKEIFGYYMNLNELHTNYYSYFPNFVRIGVEADLLSKELLNFDLEVLAKALKPDRDKKFLYLGVQTLYDRYFLHIEGRRIELPQVFFMRVAMGLALKEQNKNEKAIEFYNLLSNFDFMCSTPTLFNSGTTHSQLSSCFLTTLNDDLDSIFQCIKENAMLQKYAGGLGNDWTPVRARGSHIKGTNGESQGVILFLKVVNDTAVAVNQGGKRKGAVCVYLEVWHLDIEEFLDLRKNTGDERRRTHDINTAAWVPDLFMKRVMEGGDWTLFSPSEAKELHDAYGSKFEELYLKYEELAENGKIKSYKKLPAVQLWRKMLSMLFETGHPWITFKDPCNLRSPQQHAGVIHSSNLCTEITLNTSSKETAVCNLGSINLVSHIKDGKLDSEKLKKTIKTAMRMLDNVIDVNYYITKQGETSNMLNRPVGLGIMGFADSLFTLKIPYASEEAISFADKTMEEVCYYAYQASSDLAIERGAYSTFKGSLWDQGIMPIDSLEILLKHRGKYLEVDTASSLDWSSLREKIKKTGMRNSNCVAIAPTATISNIVGVSASIEPIYQNLYVKSNMSGEFTVVNTYMVNDLKKLNIWDEMMVADLKYFDGSLANIERIPENLKKLYATAFEIEPEWLIEAASRRQKWIDQAQSLNIYFSNPSGKRLDQIYKLAWIRGLKTTYYLRSLGASQIEKADKRSDIIQSETGAYGVCDVNNQECEVCQ